MKPFLAIAFLLFSISSQAQVRLPQLIRDSMILQRDAAINVWGWAAAGEKVKISFKGKKYNAITGADGKWKTTINASKAGGPYIMNIDASNHITLKDILVGDVWLCAGQSNMVHQMSLHSERYAADIASADYPQIRQFWVPNTTNLQAPQTDLPFGFWKSANSTDVRDFSAVAYFFAKALFEKYQVPIGLINASWGGTPIEAWTSEEGLKDFAAIIQKIQKNKDTAYVNGVNRSAQLETAKRPQPQDKGMLEPVKWYEATYAVHGWRNIMVPGYWEDQGVRNLDGVVWYRKELEVPSSMANAAAKIALGRIVDGDVVYVNGKEVGNTTYQYPQRRYTVPAGVLKPGKNVIVVRVFNYGGKGGFVPDKPYYLTAGKDTVDLKGVWQYKVGDAFVPQKPVETIAQQNQPTALFNAMVAPLTNYNIKGCLWYQGESNIGNANDYEKLLPALISDWRRQWKSNSLPFLFVQLPNFDDNQYLPTESPWAVLREAQRKTLTVPHTGMAVTIDLGEWNDIHPDRKKEVGDRLAYEAMRVAYGEKNVPASPLVQSATRDGNKIILTFCNVGDGLTVNGRGELAEFAIAAADKRFVWATAKIEGDKLFVWNDAVSAPMYVRYAWSDNPVNPNLYNKDGLPASPFQIQVEPNAK